MPIKVKAWLSHVKDLAVPGNFPVPLLSDDRDKFPLPQVKVILDWLESAYVSRELAEQPPTRLIIKLANRSEPGKVEGTIVIPDSLHLMAGDIELQRGVFEIVLRDNAAQIVLGSYHYMGATTSDGRVIVLPKCLKFVPKASPTVQIYNSLPKSQV